MALAKWSVVSIIELIVEIENVYGAFIYDEEWKKYRPWKIELPRPYLVCSLVSIYKKNGEDDEDKICGSQCDVKLIGYLIFLVVFIVFKRYLKVWVLSLIHSQHSYRSEDLNYWPSQC